MSRSDILSVKNNMPIITKKLTCILNQSILSGCFPGQLKEARVTPLFKHVFADDPNNYRPISVLSTISKPHLQLLF
jgi:hypothetical protein